MTEYYVFLLGLLFFHILQEVDPWTIGKKLLSDLSLIDRLTSQVDVATHSTQIGMISTQIICDPSWDPTSFAKSTFHNGEPIALLIEAWCLLFQKQQVCKHV